MFKYTQFIVIPAKGVLGPNSYSAFKIEFKTTQASVIVGTITLEVEGEEQRVHRLSAVGISNMTQENTLISLYRLINLTSEMYCAPKRLLKNCCLRTALKLLQILMLPLSSILIVQTTSSLLPLKQDQSQQEVLFR